MKNNEPNTAAGIPSPARKKFRIHYSHVIMGLAAFAYFFALQTDQTLAADMWSKAEDIMKDVYGKILGISTIAAIVTASVALLGALLLAALTAIFNDTVIPRITQEIEGLFG